MRQGIVYVCKWSERVGGGYRGIVSKPPLCVEANTLDEIAHELTLAIADSTGDCEPVIEFEPPITSGNNRNWFHDGIVVVRPNSHFRIGNVASIVDGGFCERCKFPRGGRTVEPVSVESMWPGDASFSWDPRAEGLRILLVSERILEAFSKSERRTFDVRGVRMPSNKRKKFMEIVPRLLIPKVAIASLDVSGWHCRLCGHVRFSHGRKLGLGVPAIARTALPDNSIFFVGTSTDYQLCMRPKVWTRMKSLLRKATMSSQPVAAIENDQIAKVVAVPEIDEVRRRIAVG